MNESGVLSGIETKFSTPPTTNFSHGHMNTSGVLGGVGKSLATPPGTNLLTGHMNISGGGGIVSGAESNFVTPLVKNLLNLTLGFLDEEEEDGFRGTGRGGGGGGEFDSYWDENLNSSSSSSSFFPSSSSSSSANESEYVWDEDDLLYRHSLQIAALLCLSYIIVFILGLVGNCFVIAVVFRTPRMRTPTNYFIVNLAMADVLVVVFCLPATLLSNIYYPWMLGWLMCKSVAYVQGVSVSASVNSLVAVSLDRFLAIWFPMKLQITTYRARAIIVLIWIMAVVSPIPYFVYFETNVFIPELPDLLVCVEMWPSREAEWLYFLIAHLLLCYLLPLVLISFCYIMIWIKVARRDIPGDTRDAAIQQMQQRSKVKVVKMLVVVVIIFMLSWLPLYVIFARIKSDAEVPMPRKR